MGTAGEMLDLPPAARLEPIPSSLSRIVFSWDMILRVAIGGCVCPVVARCVGAGRCTGRMVGRC